ncbi:hypothetical protein ASPWEDRAFT_175551 [Aspergillus wentii DTO 134E9]|uniref:Uncharacterized protein n=1 Tax=Aspergillus wentii DTO 134E9 TaxID=1073089 RepID=A0A1L9RBL9_ASPWE|nr:uncharacterized protein ASPWEDRAFT_175551 [Aspergillus wentii DTO 134E9]KAI9934824.1 hypothetical protein MW887_000441 [Aspergillus wentii]OJJ32257.1 hypothetical protein ASPWEDRAFT_175551 [Aspergillus wentii DTO 134E9]
MRGYESLSLAELSFQVFLFITVVTSLRSWIERSNVLNYAIVAKAHFHYTGRSSAGPILVPLAATKKKIKCDLAQLDRGSMQQLPGCGLLLQAWA